MDFRNRAFGALVGLAAGDALGTTLEFQQPGAFTPIQDIVGGGPFSLQPGEWTDDTSMALCLAESLVEVGWDPSDQARRYVRWMRDGYLSSNGRCFDIGNTVRAALTRFEATGEPFSGPTDAASAGNGSLMRLAPVPVYYANDPAQAVHACGESSRVTHGTRQAVDSCRYYGGLIVGALLGAPKSVLLNRGFGLTDAVFESLDPKVQAVAAGSFAVKKPPEIQGSGYVIECLEAALWAFAGTESFAEGALAAANLGRDADTTAAVYGQLAGAYYGLDGIPAHWRRRLSHRDLIETLAERLAAHGSGPAT